MTSNALKAEKLEEIKREMQDTGLWLPGDPGREEYREHEAEAFFGWLQVACGEGHPVAEPAEKKYIVPHAVRVFGDDVNRGKLLQLLIELDAIL